MKRKKTSRNFFLLYIIYIFNFEKIFLHSVSTIGRKQYKKKLTLINAISVAYVPNMEHSNFN